MEDDGTLEPPVKLTFYVDGKCIGTREFKTKTEASEHLAKLTGENVTLFMSY